MAERPSEFDQVTQLAVSIAKYAERLDNFIVSQVQMNKDLVESHKDVVKKVEGLVEWRDKISGGKILLGALVFLAVNAAVILGTVTALN